MFRCTTRVTTGIWPIILCYISYSLPLCIKIYGNRSLKTVDIHSCCDVAGLELKVTTMRRINGIEWRFLPPPRAVDPILNLFGTMFYKYSLLGLWNNVFEPSLNVQALILAPKLGHLLKGFLVVIFRQGLPSKEVLSPTTPTRGF